MEVPVTFNLSLGKASGSGVDLVGSDSKELAGRGFSEHLGENVDRIKGEQKERHAAPPTKLNRVGVVAEDEAVSKTNTSRGENDVPKETIATQFGMPKGLDALIEEGSVLEQAPGLSTAIGIISEKRHLGIGFADDSISGNELPQAAGINAGALSASDEEVLLADETGILLTDGSVVNLDVQDKKIIFDPLGQANEKSAQMPASTVGHLPNEKVKFNGKNNAADFFNSSSVALPTDESNNADVRDVLLDRIQKPLQEANSVSSLAKDIGVTKITTESLQANPAVMTIEARQQAAVDRPTIQLDTPMNSSRWGENFSQRVQWVVNQSMSGAQIRLNPQHMGPVEVRIQMQNDQAVVSFTAQHGATREAIDAALPRLREMLSEQNVNVVDIDVSQHSFAEQRDHQMSNNGDDKDHLSNTDQESDDSVFDQQDNEQQRQYSGLFSDFA